MALGILQGVTLATNGVPSTDVNTCALSLWYRHKQGANTSNSTPLYLGNSGANGWGLCGMNTNVLGGLLGGVSFLFTASLVIPVGMWVHMVFQRNTTWVMYRDNLFASSAQAGTPNAPATSLTVNGGSGGREHFDVCDLAMWERLLTQQERAFLAAGGSPLELASGGVGGPKWYVPALGSRHGYSQDLTDVIGGYNLYQTSTRPPLYHDELPPQVVSARGLDFSTLWVPRIGEAPGAPPVNTVAPVVSGTPEVGQTLSTTNGTWTGNPAPTFTYQWQYYRTGVWSNIAAATNATWVVDISGAVDAGDLIRCQVTGTNASGNATADSNSTTAVTTVSFTNQYLGVSVS